MQLIRARDESDLVKKLSLLIERLSNEAVADHGKFYVGFSGGSLIKYLVQGLPQIKADWSHWVIAFCDERVVPESSEESTYGTYVRELLPKVPLLEEQLISIRQGVSAEEAAINYRQKLQSAFKTDSENFTFDLLLLGLGPDGHTCSLFPGHQLLDEKMVSVASIMDSPKPPPNRITLTYPVINHARNCVFATAGEEKAEIIKRILVDKEDFPAGRVQPASGKLYWLLDDAAAKLIP